MANASVFNQVINWIELVVDTHEEVDKHSLWDDLIFNGGFDEYEGIQPFTWENGDHNTNMTAIFDYLLATHGSEACFEAFMNDGWGDVSYLQANGHNMGNVVWQYDGVYCCKCETMMSVLTHYNYI